MAPVYHHKQSGNFIVIIFACVAAVVAIVGGVIASPVMLVAIPILALVGWVFSSLTVQLTENELIWFFGPGLWNYRLPVAQIAAVEPVKNKWWYGWGIRITPHGWLYNVSGLDAVQILRTDGKKRRIGTDEPSELTEAIRSLLPSD